MTWPFVKTLALLIEGLSSRCVAVALYGPSGASGAWPARASIAPATTKPPSIEQAHNARIEDFLIG
jgi:hypothetical protein